MDSDYIIISIQPRHAKNIFIGNKTVELRRVRPKRLKEGAIVIVYVSSPKKEIYGAFIVSQVIEKEINDLWATVRDKASITKDEFDNYFSGMHKGVAIFISKVWCLSKPIKLNKIRRIISNFNPPQSFRYISYGGKDYNKIRKKLDFNNIYRNK